MKRIRIVENKNDPDPNLSEFLRINGEEKDYEFWYSLFTHKAKFPNIIEFGCGCGNLAIPLAKAGCQVLAIDCDPHSVEYLREHAPKNLVVQHGDFEEFWQDGEYDGVVLRSCVLNTTSNEGRERFFVNASRLIGAEGRVVIEIFRNEWIEKEMIFRNEAQIFRFTPTKNKRALLEAIYLCGDVEYELIEEVEEIDKECLNWYSSRAGLVVIGEPISRTPLSKIVILQRALG